jgi:hypothetical protein
MKMKDKTTEKSSYRNLEWEPESQGWLFFEESLKRLRKAGYDRHPRPDEAFGLIIDHLEGKLDGDLEKIASNMLATTDNWLNMAIERKGDVLVCYVEPKNIKWFYGRYIVDEEWHKYVVDEDVRSNLKYSHKKEFDISGIRSGGWVDLERFSPDFVKYFYTREFDDLPEQMKTGDLKARVFLSRSNNGLYPVSRGAAINENFAYSIVSSILMFQNEGRHSQGVRDSEET